MPRVFKSGKELKGNKKSGRKTDAEIVRSYIDTDLANTIGNQELKRIKNTPISKRKRADLKEIVMPIVVKNMGEKIEHSGAIGNYQLSKEEIKKLDDILNDNQSKSKNI